MITGDHSATARAVARELGLRGVDKALTGRDLDVLAEADWPETAEEVDVYARTSPEHKLRLVQALQDRGQVVAMTGDGVNDAPALKRADIGIAMGKRGTEAAKEASEMVLADDNFATIALAVRSGRTVYDNLKKSILFMLPTNGGQAFTVVAAILFGAMLPVTPVQILWVNMVTTVTLALGLSFEQGEPNIMERPPRGRKEPILSKLLVWRICFVSALLVIATFGLFYRAREAGIDIETARTIAVNTLVAGQVVYLFSARVIDGPAWSAHALGTCKPALISVGIMVVLQGLFIHLPVMNFLFGTAPLGLNDWWPILLSAVAIFLIVEAEKAIMRRWG
jgi:magnesium-transporting ATPase (P-type)